MGQGLVGGVDLTGDGIGDLLFGLTSDDGDDDAAGSVVVLPGEGY